MGIIHIIYLILVRIESLRRLYNINIYVRKICNNFRCHTLNFGELNDFTVKIRVLE
uniref:Uncharacterized protein n=1 Tax=Lepeophtheirus salmonis TaxID=72036 RepID=A0A0K2SWE9_LEPSM